MGGYIGWQFWQHHARRLRSLVLCDTRAGDDTSEARENRFRMAEQVLREGSRVAAEAMIPKLFAERTRNERGEMVERVRRWILDTPPTTIAAAQLGMAERPDMTDMLPHIDVPALVLCGEFDAISPPEEMRAFAAMMPQARYVEIAGAGHMAPMEEPAAVNQAIREFLAE
jgi:3-oxoadipate enol-lactonase